MTPKPISLGQIFIVMWIAGMLITYSLPPLTAGSQIMLDPNGARVGEPLPAATTGTYSGGLMCFVIIYFVVKYTNREAETKKG